MPDRGVLTGFWIGKPPDQLHVYGEHGYLRGVVVHLVVRCELVIPFQLAGVGVERNHAIGIQVVTETNVSIGVGRRGCRYPRMSGSFRRRKRRCSRSQLLRFSTTTSASC